MSGQSPKSTSDLRESERRLLRAMQELGHGRFESLLIDQGQVLLDPWPTTVRSIKFGATANKPVSASIEFELKHQVAEFFAHVRRIEAGMIRVLEVRGGLPFSMEISDG